jgi:Na+-translocating ferredoxin:NAD+ oxidoreductase RnfD subunit
MTTEIAALNNRPNDAISGGRATAAEEMSAPAGKPRLQLTALRRFAIAITALNLLGHTALGFEQSLAQPLAALATAYSIELLLEFIDSIATKRKPRFVGGFRKLVDFLLSAHITGLACAMLLYANDRLWPIMFAVAVALGSKTIFRVPVGNRSRHVFNPSNLGITATLLCFPTVGVAQPYMFTENIHGVGDWLLPLIIIGAGFYLNATLTRRIPLILTWLVCFVAQGLLRSAIFGTPMVAPLLPLTGMAFLLFTFYMVTDPATTPSDTKGQMAFGAAVAAAYGLLVANHIVFGLFFALTSVCTVRWITLSLSALTSRRAATSTAGRNHAVVAALPATTHPTTALPAAQELAGMSAGTEG